MENRKSFIMLAENIFCSVLLLPCDEEISVEEVRKSFKRKIDDFAREAINNGHSAYEIENAKYALCAWIDEYIYANCSIAAKWFSHSFALSEFEDVEAGKHFFDRMDALHKNANYTPLLEVYAKCILFGFMGKFRVGETTELKQVLNSAISKTNFLEPINFKPATKNRHRFSFRRGIKNILVTGLCEEKCKEIVKRHEPPKGYSYIYSNIEDYENLPFIDGVVLLNPLQADGTEKQEEFLKKLFSKQGCKAPIYKVADFEIQEISQTLDKNYEFNSNHLNYYLHRNFLDDAACKNILSLPKKLKQFKDCKAFYSLPFFPFMQNEKPLAYSLVKKMLKISFLAGLLFSIIFFVFSIVNEHKEEIKAEAVFILQKKKIDSLKLVEDSIKFVEDSLNLEFENRLKNLELYYQKHILEKFPFREGKIPSVAEVSDFFSREGEFYKFMDIIDTISDERIKFNRRTLLKLAQLKNSVWSDIPISIIVKAPRTASVSFGIDSQYVDIEQGSSRSIDVLFPKQNGGGIELSAKTANNAFRESIKGEWSLLKLQNRHEFSFMDRSYLVDVELLVHWNVPRNSIKPKDWFALRLEPNLIENLALTRNLGER
ncbi:MAG: DotU family type IV/VI secretion system protein [Fibromonadaceae bacterium]|jgi:type IV/VI secretion system ImpK/VasF family protein|nr:DotU family type IV/VI secretion system protein [Fibromonadaceae bacterium]